MLQTKCCRTRSLHSSMFWSHQQQWMHEAVFGNKPNRTNHLLHDLWQSASRDVAFKANKKMINFVWLLAVLSVGHQLENALHPLSHVATSCLGLTFSPLIDSSVLRVVCFACLWNLQLCLKAPWIVLTELMRNSGLDLDCFGIVVWHTRHTFGEDALPDDNGAPKLQLLTKTS